MRDAAFARGGETIVPPQTLEVAEGERFAHACAGDRVAAIVAMMAAGLVRASAGRVLVAAFDPRVQPVHVKRLAGFVPHSIASRQFASFEAYAEYRAALWGLPPAEAVVRGRRVLEALHNVHESFAFPIAGALLAHPRLLVLDRPEIAYAERIARAAAACAIFSTHRSQREAELFAEASAAAV